MKARGPDLSKWQQEFIYQNNIDFIIVKATEGWGFDPKFEDYLPEVKKVPRRGAYHYYRTETDPIVQAENFLAYTEGEGFHFLCVDYEATGNTLDQQGANNLMLCMRYLEDNQDLPVVLYTSPYIYRDNLLYWDNGFYDFPLWLARYSGADPETGDPAAGIIVADWDIWQYTSKADGAEYGVGSDYVDMNVYNGTVEEMDAWLGIEEEPCCPELESKINSRILGIAQLAKRMSALEARVVELEHDSHTHWWKERRSVK